MAAGPQLLRTIPALALLGLSLACAPVDRTERAPVRRQPTTTYSFSIVEDQLPRFLFLGRERRAEIVLINDGYQAWPSEDRFFFSPRWEGLTGDESPEQGFRTPLPEDVAPGGQTRLTVRTKTPSSLGLYRVYWDLQSESSGWFSQFDRTPEPPRWVLILPRVEFLLGVLVPVLVLAAAVGLRRRRRETGAAAATFVGIADLLWCAASLWGKPYFLYGELNAKFWPGPKPIVFAVIAFVLLPLALLAPRVRATAAWILAAFGALTVWAQLLYYRFFRDLASSVAALAGRQTTELGSTVTALAEARDLWIWVDVALALPILWLIARGPRPLIRRASRWLPVALAVLAMPFLWSGIRVLATSQLHSRRNLQNLRSVSTCGLFGFQMLDAGTRIAGSLRSPEIKPAQLRQVVDWFESTAAARRAQGPSAGAAAGLNLIAIQVESMQGFLLDLDIKGAPVTPNLRRLEERALDFTMVLDQTNRGRSSAGDFVTQTSLLPVGESIAYEHPHNDYVSLARALADHGYRTLSAIPYKSSFWNRRVTHAAYGFETRLFQEAFERRGPKVGWGINDRDFLNDIVPVLERLDPPFFAWLTTLSVHYPYESFPRELEHLDIGDLEGTPFGNYLHGMNFFDRAFGDFIERLEQARLLDQSVIVIWGDHASGLERDPQFVDFFGLDSPGKKFLFRRVPFVILLPENLRLARRDSSPAGQVDIAPTLLALMGVDPGALALMGRNLLGGTTDRLVVHPQGRWLDNELIFLSQFEEEDGGCWSALDLSRVEPRRCARGTAATERQLEVVDLVLGHDLQAEVTRRLQNRPAH